jgi:cardiolipin synthase (CMP-forming)
MNIIRYIYLLPNILTILRILSILPIILSFYVDNQIIGYRIAAAIFLFACLTDYLDGYLSRKLSVTSQFGAMLDPIADKILVSAVMIMLIKFDRIDAIPCIIILAREFLVSGLRDYYANNNIIIPVSKLAKWKTASQMMALFALILGSDASGLPYMANIGGILLWISVFLTIITGYFYCGSAQR